MLYAGALEVSFRVNGGTLILTAIGNPTTSAVTPKVLAESILKFSFKPKRNTALPLTGITLLLISLKSNSVKARPVGLIKRIGKVAGRLVVVTSNLNSVPSLALVMVLPEASVHLAVRAGDLEVSLMVKLRLATSSPVVLFLKLTLPVFPLSVKKFSNTCAVNCKF